MSKMAKTTEDLKYAWRNEYRLGIYERITNYGIGGVYGWVRHGMEGNERRETE